MHTADVVYSDSLEQATARFLDDLQGWVDDCLDRYADAPPTDVHDQLTYTVAWGPVIQHRGHDRALAFLKAHRDAVRRHYLDTGQWHHGYWKKHEVHHGTEHFELFMRNLWRLAPDDEATVEQFMDATEHVGNWVAGIPEWFEDGRPRRMNPITLYVAGVIQNEDAKRMAAVDLARTYFNLARQVYPDGRDHGCSARSVSAIARGHGRDNNAGKVTAVLDPALDAMR